MKRTTVTILAAVTMMVALSGSAQAAPIGITIATVRVGDVGNAADTSEHSDNAAGQGAVSYAYNIGKYEVTNSQYTAFLNAADAGGANANGIYNTDNMGTDPRGGITYTPGSTSGTKYTVRTNMGDKPVNYVSYWHGSKEGNTSRRECNRHTYHNTLGNRLLHRVMPAAEPGKVLPWCLAH